MQLQALNTVTRTSAKEGGLTSVFSTCGYYDILALRALFTEIGQLVEIKNEVWKIYQ